MEAVEAVGGGFAEKAGYADLEVVLEVTLAPPCSLRFRQDEAW